MSQKRVGIALLFCISLSALYWNAAQASPLDKVVNYFKKDEEKNIVLKYSSELKTTPNNYVVVQAKDSIALLYQRWDANPKPCFPASGSPIFRNSNSISTIRETAISTGHAIIRYDGDLPKENGFLVAFKAARSAGKIQACSYFHLQDESPLQGSVKVDEESINPKEASGAGGAPNNYSGSGGHKGAAGANTAH